MWPFRKKEKDYPEITFEGYSSYLLVYVEGMLFCRLYDSSSKGLKLEVLDNDLGDYWCRTRTVYSSRKAAAENIRTLIKGVGIQYFLHLLRTSNPRYAADILFGFKTDSLCASCPHKKFHDEYEKEKIEKEKIRKLELDE